MSKNVQFLGLTQSMHVSLHRLEPKDFAAKNAIFRSSKSANFVKNLATNP